MTEEFKKIYNYNNSFNNIDKLVNKILCINQTTENQI